MVCPYCQAQLPDDARYCKECGGDVTLALAPVPTSGQQSIEPRRVNSTQITPAEEHARNTRIGIVVVASIGLITILCAIVSLLLLA